MSPRWGGQDLGVDITGPSGTIGADAVLPPALGAARLPAVQTSISPGTSGTRVLSLNQQSPDREQGEAVPTWPSGRATPTATPDTIVLPASGQTITMHKSAGSEEIVIRADDAGAALSQNSHRDLI